MPKDAPHCLRSAVCTLYLTGAQASGANIDVAGRALHDCLDTLDIGLPCTVGTTVRVRDLDTKCNALAADFAFCHSWHLLYRLVTASILPYNEKKSKSFLQIRENLSKVTEMQAAHLPVLRTYCFFCMFFGICTLRPLHFSALYGIIN